MSGHTPGPWDYRSQPHDDWGVVRAGRYIICQARDPKVDHLDLSHYRKTKTDPFEANARLISAAPDHYGAAREIDRLSLVILSAVKADQSGQYDAVVAAILANRAAIAKASPPPPAGADDGID